MVDQSQKTQLIESEAYSRRKPSLTKNYMAHKQIEKFNKVSVYFKFILLKPVSKLSLLLRYDQSQVIASIFSTSSPLSARWKDLSP